MLSQGRHKQAWDRGEASSLPVAWGALRGGFWPGPFALSEPPGGEVSMLLFDQTAVNFGEPGE